MGPEDIVAWLSQSEIEFSQIPVQVPTATSALKSIEDNQQYEPLSPPDSRRKRSAMSHDSHHTPKRRRVQEPEVDIDQTPKATSSLGRQRYQHQHQLDTASPKSLPPPSDSQSTRSQASGRSSPTKQIAALELNPEGVETRVLSLHNRSLPSSLSALLLDFEMCSNGVQVTSKSLESEIKEHAQSDPEYHVFLPHMYAPAEERDALGPTPPIDEVSKLVSDAAEAQASRQNEAGWNMMVHWPLLDNAIYGRRRQNQLVGVACCTTAKIIKEYLPIASPAKMVDFGIYISPEADPAPGAVDVIENLRRVLPCSVINHTDFVSLRSRPLAISIESKKRNSINPETAELQLGTWHAAQWKLLEDLVRRSGGSFDGLPFLPAVIVNGHDWSFAATTREGQKTVLWLEKSFGSTSSSLGVFKAIWGLQRLAKWAREVYWPWYKQNALGITAL